MNEYDVYNIFLDFEKEKNLFNITYKGYKIWDYTRYNFYKVLCCSHLGMFNQIQEPINPTNVQKDKYIEDRMLNVDTLKHYDLVLMGNPRRVKQTDGYYHDIYTDYIPELVGDYTTLTVEDPFWCQFSHQTDSHLIPAKTENIVYTDYLIKDFYNAYFDENILTQEKADLYNIFKNIADIFSSKFNFDFDIAITNARLIMLFIMFTEDEYCKMLKKVNPKAILFIFHPNPSCLSLLNCAKKLNIPIAEIQHGIFGEFEPIWHKFRDTNREYVLPDAVLTMAPKIVFENDMCMTAEKGQLKYVGYPFLERKIKEYENIKKDRKVKNILFVSQSNIGVTLSKFAAELADLLKDNPEYHIIYKLHPFELKREYPHLNKDNVTIIKDLEKDIYYYAKKSTIQIGVYSTAIYEAIEFGVSTIIAEDIMGGKEALKILDGLDGVYSAKNAKEAYKIIMSNPKITSGKEPFWPKVDKTTYTQAIEDIINRK